jgi:hypothetical protein
VRESWKSDKHKENQREEESKAEAVPMSLRRESREEDSIFQSQEQLTGMDRPRPKGPLSINHIVMESTKRRMKSDTHDVNTREWDQLRTTWSVGAVVDLK